jgi:hypothetical protein
MTTTRVPQAGTANYAPNSGLSQATPLNESNPVPNPNKADGEASQVSTITNFLVPTHPNVTVGAGIGIGSNLYLVPKSSG